MTIIRSILRTHIIGICVDSFFNKLISNFNYSYEESYLRQCHAELSRIYGATEAETFDEYLEYYHMVLGRVGKDKVFLYADFDLKDLQNTETFI